MCPVFPVMDIPCLPLKIKIVNINLSCEEKKLIALLKSVVALEGRRFPHPSARGRNLSSFSFACQIGIYLNYDNKFSVIYNNSL